MMKLSEVIARLEKVNSKKFTSDHYEISIDGCGLINIKCQGRRTTFDMRIDREWEEVRQPVTFTEAVEAVKEGSFLGLKYVKFDMEYTNWPLDDLMHKLGKNHSAGDLAEIISQGKWFIE